MPFLLSPHCLLKTHRCQTTPLFARAVSYGVYVTSLMKLSTVFLPSDEAKKEPGHSPCIPNETLP